MTGIRSPEGTFTIYSPVFNNEPGSVFGLWATEHRALAAEGSTVLTTSGGEDRVVWQIHLPPDTDAAQLNLEKAKTSLNETVETLALAERRFVALIQSPTTIVAFDSSAKQGSVEKPEQALLMLLAELQRNEAISFSLYGQLSGAWQRAIEEFQAFVARLQVLLANFSDVETQVGGRLLGRTVVDWKGDLRTLWGKEINEAQTELHKRTVALAIASKDALLRMFILVTANAAKLSLLISTGNMLLALPAALKFVQDFLIEAEKFRARSAR